MDWSSGGISSSTFHVFSFSIGKCAVVVLILQSEKWPFSVAPWLVDDRSLRQNHYRRHRHLLRGLFDIHADLLHRHRRRCHSVHPHHRPLQGI